MENKTKYCIVLCAFKILKWKIGKIRWQFWQHVLVFRSRSEYNSGMLPRPLPIQDTVLYSVLLFLLFTSFCLRFLVKQFQCVTLFCCWNNAMPFNCHCHFKETPTHICFWFHDQIFFPSKIFFSTRAIVISNRFEKLKPVRETGLKLKPVWVWNRVRHVNSF